MEIKGGLKKSQGILMIALSLGVISLVMSIITILVTERWLKQKNNVSCVPSDVEYSQPLTYRQSATHPVQNDALLKTFVEEYIRLTQNENSVDYHQLTQHQRYDKARLSQNKWKAIELSLDRERALNMNRYADSAEIFKILDQGNLGWVFLIDDVILYNVPNSGATLAVVRGEFQVTYDKVKAELPPRLWGYREIQLMILQGVPTADTKDNDINKYGLYVAESSIETITPERKELLDKRNSSYYLKEMK